jgi:hypothetical protein
MRLWLSIPAGAAVLVAGGYPQITWGSVVASLLVCAVLAVAAERSTGSGPGLIVMLAGLLYVTFALISLPEGVLFDVIEPAGAVVSLAWMLVITVAAVTVQVAVAGRLEPAPPTPTSSSPIRSTRGLLWRLAAAPAVFILFYFVAGLIIFPFVEPYYEGRVMPDPQAIVSMQVLRSLAIVGAAYPLLRTIHRRRDAVLVLALALPVFGAVAPLLPANDLMPGSIRLVHALETVPYYALFGALVAVWFGPPRRRSSDEKEEAPAVGRAVVA